MRAGRGVPSPRGCGPPPDLRARTLAPARAPSDGLEHVRRALAQQPSDPRPAPHGADHLRRQGPGHRVSRDRAAAAARGRSQRLGRADRRLRLRRLERVRRALRDAHRRAAGGRRAEVQPLPHDGAVLADPPGASHRPQPSHGGHGRNHGDRDLGAGLQLGPPGHCGAAGRDPEAERLLHRAVRQVPRGAGLGDEPDGPVRRLALGRGWLRALLRLHRWRDQPVRPGDLRGHHAGRARPHAGGGLPLHRGHDRPRDRLDPSAEGADARQAVLHVLRARRDPRPAPRARRVVGQVQGQVRPGLGRPARGDASRDRRSWA